MKIEEGQRTFELLIGSGGGGCDKKMALKQQKPFFFFLEAQLRARILIPHQRLFTELSVSEDAAAPSLSQIELGKVNLLIPRLCLINQLPTAIHLTTTVLLLPNPPLLKSLSLPILIHSLVSQPEASLPMSLLTRLTRTPTQLTPITTMVIASYLNNRKTGEAVEVFNWMMRPGSPCLPEPASYRELLGAFCRNGLTFEALKVMSAMLAVNSIPDTYLRRSVCGNLLREARIKEAIELEMALAACGSGGSAKAAIEVVDRIFRDWAD